MATGDLTTLQNVKLYLGLTAATDDALLGTLITAASAWIKSYLNRDVLEATYVETYDGTGTPKLVLGEYPVSSVSVLTVDGTAVASSLYAVRNATLVRTDGGTWAKGYGNVEVTYTAGYATTPADIAQACLKMVAWAYKEKDHIGQSSKTAGGQETVAYITTDVPADVKTLLNNWRKVVPV